MVRLSGAVESKMAAKMGIGRVAELQMAAVMQMENQRSRSFQKQIDSRLRNIRPCFLRRFSKMLMTAGAKKRDLETYHTIRRLSSNVLHRGRLGYRCTRYYHHTSCLVSNCASAC